MNKPKQATVLMLTFIAVSSLAGVCRGASEPVTGTITDVTVYRGQALVTRAVEVELPKELSELVVRDLPPNIIPESIYAQTSGDTKVLSVRYRQRAVGEDTREGVKQLDAQIEDVKHSLKYATSELDHHNQQWKMFESLREFTLAAEKGDLNRGLLTYEPVESLASLVEKKGVEYLERKLKLEDQIAELQKDLQLLERRRNELTAGHSRTEHEAVIFLAGAGKKVAIELSYLVTGANWHQQYNLRANPNASSVVIEYNAVVNQTSGEDWNGVSVSLSTAEPTMAAAAPLLEPMLVGLSQPSQSVQAQLFAQPIQLQVDEIVNFQKSRKASIKKGIDASAELNELARRNQVLFFNVDQSAALQLQQRISSISRTEGVSVTYELPGKLTLPSRSDQQLVTIASISTKAQFALVATPLLTDYVYLQAEVLNDSDTVFLAGPASMFRNAEFVGKSDLPLVTIGDRFKAGFGIDSQIQVVRELEDKQTRIQGGNRIETYNYRIALSNYKNTAVELQLLDRLPYTEDSSVKIVLDKTEPELSKDAEYLRTSRKKGILRWDLKLSANTASDKATVVRYSYTMEYDRNMQIEPRAATQTAETQ